MAALRTQATAGSELPVYNTREQSNGGIEVPTKASDENQRRQLRRPELAVVIVCVRISDWNRRAHSICICFPIRPFSCEASLSHP